VLGRVRFLVRRCASFRRAGYLHTLGQLVAKVLHGSNAQDQAHKQDNNPPANIRIKYGSHIVLIYPCSCNEKNAPVAHWFLNGV
jgi:hypothetical protein